MFKHLLPTGRAWRLHIDRNLPRFLTALNTMPAAARTFADLVYLDLLPQTTRALDEWDQQFNLPPAMLTEQQRRDRLAGAWRATGGQSPHYIQNTLQAAGFPVFVHEWWNPNAGPDVIRNPEAGEAWLLCGDPFALCGNYHTIGGDLLRNPFLYLRPTTGTAIRLPECNDINIECGEGLALCGNSPDPMGYPLVNKIKNTGREYTQLMTDLTPAVECGEAMALCGEFSAFSEKEKVYTIPNDPKFWHAFCYIGGETFPELATIPPARRVEFETMLLKLIPAQLWIGVLVQYQ